MRVYTLQFTLWWGCANVKKFYFCAPNDKRNPKTAFKNQIYTKHQTKIIIILYIFHLYNITISIIWILCDAMRDIIIIKMKNVDTNDDIIKMICGLWIMCCVSHLNWRIVTWLFWFGQTFVCGSFDCQRPVYGNFIPALLTSNPRKIRF